MDTIYLEPSEDFLMSNDVVFKAPKFLPMPGELTPEATREALLPAKINAMSRAIAAAQSLPELMNYKKPIDGLAAAAKTLKEFPEYARSMKRVQKETLERMGQLLLAYKSAWSTGIANLLPPKLTQEQAIEARRRHAAGETAASIANFFGVSGDVIRRVIRHPNYGKVGRQAEASERTQAAKAAGIPVETATHAVRFASAPKPLREKIIANDRISSSINIMASFTPKLGKNGGGNKHSDAAAILFHGVDRSAPSFSGRAGRNGLTHISACVRALNISVISQLTTEEKQRAKKLIVEMQEILDEMDRRLGL